MALIYFIEQTSKASTCPTCRKMNNPKCDKITDTIQNSEHPCTESVLDNLNTDVKYINEQLGQSEGLLSQEDHTDMQNIFYTVFPQCTDKMKTILMSQKMVMERHPQGRRSIRNIIRMCLSLCARDMQS